MTSECTQYLCLAYDINCYTIITLQKCAHTKQCKADIFRPLWTKDRYSCHNTQGTLGAYKQLLHVIASIILPQ